MPRLDVYTKFKLQASFKLESDKTIIGRDSRCEVLLPDNRVSRHHAVIYGDVSGHEIENLGTNGTKVNGNLIKQVHILMPGDVIAIADFLLVYQPDGTAPEDLESTRII